MRLMMLVGSFAISLQVVVPPTTLETLRLTAPAASATSAQQLTLRWEVYSSPAADVAAPQTVVRVDQFQVLSQTIVAVEAPRDRRPELAADRLVVVLANAEGTVLHWSSIADPRVVRAEQPGPNGVLAGAVLHRREAEFLLTLPNIPGTAQLRIYEPRWDGVDWALDPIGAVALAGNAR